MNETVRGYINVHVTSVTRRVGAVHLAAVGLGNLGSGAVIGFLAATDRMLSRVLPALVRYLDPFTALKYADGLGTLEAVVAPLVGLVLVVAGIGQIALARAAFRGRRFRASVLGAIAGTLNPVLAPLALVAVTLLALARGQFERPG